MPPCTPQAAASDPQVPDAPRRWHTVADTSQAGTYASVRRRFRAAVLCGVLRSGGSNLHLNPPDSLRIHVGDRLLGLTRQARLLPAAAAAATRAVRPSGAGLAARAAAAPAAAAPPRPAGGALAGGSAQARRGRGGTCSPQPEPSEAGVGGEGQDDGYRPSFTRAPSMAGQVRRLPPPEAGGLAASLHQPGEMGRSHNMYLHHARCCEPVLGFGY